jgi:hypothetical protein
MQQTEKFAALVPLEKQALRSRNQTVIWSFAALQAIQVALNRGVTYLCIYLEGLFGQYVCSVCLPWSLNM